MAASACDGLSNAALGAKVPTEGLTNLWKAPGRIAAVDARVIEADSITRRIAQVRFPPQPWLISGSGLEPDTRAHQLLHGRVQIMELEVHDDSARRRGGEATVQRKGGCTDWTCEPRVVRWIVDDEAQPEPSVEGNRGVEVSTGDCYLVEVHEPPHN